MKSKSKFVAFIISFIPGLSHLYLGFSERALIFFILFGGAITSVSVMAALSNLHQFLVILAFLLPVIWFIALTDAFSLIDRMNAGSCEPDAGPLDLIAANIGTTNRKIITVSLSIVPGAGHMYLGLLKEGVLLMTGFFFAMFIMGWLGMSLFVFILPVIWFYSLFDAFHRVDNAEYEEEHLENGMSRWLSNNPRIIGWALIIFGCAAIFDKIVSPLITWEIRNYMQTGLVSLLLIAGGIYLLKGPVFNSTPKEEEEVSVCDNVE